MKVSVNFRLEAQTIEDLKTLAKINTRSNTNQIEVLIAAAKEDLKARGKWPLAS